jgi:hypothetical protein
VSIPVISVSSDPVPWQREEEEAEAEKQKDFDEEAFLGRRKLEQQNGRIF